MPIATTAYQRATDKYLRHYGEVEIAALPASCGPFRQVLVIPAYNEAPALLNRLDALFAATPALLVILVINRPTGSDCDTRLPEALRRRYRCSATQDNLSWHIAARNGALLLVDRFTEGRCIAANQGVGLARKIGCDLACQLMHRGQIASRWMFSSDADVHWPAAYFEAGRDAAPSCSALSLRFAHQPQAGLPPLPTQLYEFSLHYYVLGLARAGSPYAHHSVGSALAIDYQHYARVRGFPRRAAGEDFYLLNKLAKSGPIAAQSAPTITILDRQSARAPFGTGVARARIDNLPSPLHDYPLYHPQCFVELGRAQHWLDELSATPAQSPERWQQRLADDGERCAPWLSVLAAMGAGAAVAHAAQHSRDPTGCQRHLQQWFDGFRTLKFIHALRERHYPSLSLTTLLAEADGAGLLPALPTLPDAPDEQLRWLLHSNRIMADQLFT